MNIAVIAAHTESIALIQLTVTAFKNDHFSQPTKQSKVVLCDLLVVAVARSRKHRGVLEYYLSFHTLISCSLKSLKPKLFFL